MQTFVLEPWRAAVLRLGLGISRPVLWYVSGLLEIAGLRTDGDIPSWKEHTKRRASPSESPL